MNYSSKSPHLRGGRKDKKLESIGTTNNGKGIEENSSSTQGQFLHGLDEGKISQPYISEPVDFVLKMKM